MERWKKRDPIPALEAVLREAGLLRPEDLDGLTAEVSREIEEAVAFAEESAWEPVDDLLRDVQAEPGSGGTP